jgi:hypothetical protein
MEPEPFASSIMLQFSGSDLDPDGLTDLLGIKPSLSAQSGGPVHSPSGDKPGPAKTGYWSIRGEWNDLQSPDQKIHMIMESATPDHEVWRTLAGKYSGRFLCHVSRLPSRQMFRLNSETMAAISDRGLVLDIIFEVPDH